MAVGSPAPKLAPLITLDGITLAYGPNVIQSNISMDVRRGSIFVVMGESGCGKSTVLRSMIGLLRPAAGQYRLENEDYWTANDARRTMIAQRFGVLFQSGALWSSMTVGENVALPMQINTRLDATSIRAQVELKLGLVGMLDAIDHYPSELSGGMKKRAGLARALALDPDILFLDEPTAGLDPVASARLEELILNLHDGLGTTIVVISHELPTLFALADNGIYFDNVTRSPIAHGSPSYLRDHCDDPQVRAFMQRLPSNTA